MSQAPAGWYPQEDGVQWYWDGTQWTGHTHPPAEEAAADAAAPAAESIAAAEPAAAAAPAAPAVAAPVAVAPPREPGVGFGQVFGVWWSALLTLFKQGPEEAHGEIVAADKKTGNSHFTWIAVVGVNAILTLILSLYLVLDMSEAARFALEIDGAKGIVLAILLPFVFAFGIFLFRVVTIVATGAVIKAPISFIEAARIAAVAWIASAPVLVFAFLAMLTEVSFFVYLMMVVWVFVAYFSEIAVFAILSKREGVSRLPYLVHAGLTAIWLSITVWIVGESVGNVISRFMVFGAF